MAGFDPAIFATMGIAYKLVGPTPDPPLWAEMKRLILALAMVAMLACSGCPQWAHEPCAWCGGGPGPGEGGGH
jgi:hypothetical protein